MPGRGQGTRLRFAVAHYAAGDQLRIVEHRTIRVEQRITQFATFVDGTGSFRRGVAGNAARERKLAEQAPHSLLVLRDIGIQLAVAAFEIGVRYDCRAAVAGAGNKDHAEFLLPDGPVHVHIDEVQARRGTPVPEQAWLDMRRLQRLFQQRVVKQINLPH